MTLLPLLAQITGSIHVGLAALGSAVGVGLIGMKAAEATGRNPGAGVRHKTFPFSKTFSWRIQLEAAN